jgi:hypothetical protein
MPMSTLARRFSLPVVLLAWQGAACGAKPCEAVASDVVASAAYQEQDKAILSALRACLSGAEVCSLTRSLGGDSPAVLATTKAKVPADDGRGRSSLLVAVQDERAGTCLVASFSGGSAAAWAFGGWAVHEGRARRIPGFDEFAHDAEFESTKTLVGLIAQASGRAPRHP